MNQLGATFDLVSLNKTWQFVEIVDPKNISQLMGSELMYEKMTDAFKKISY